MTSTSNMQQAGSDICDVLESAAIEATSLSDKESIQLASCPRAHACLQGLVERRFHPIHLRDFYSVINYLLLRLSLLLHEKDLTSNERGGGEGGSAAATAAAAEVAKLKRQVAELQRKNKERKAKYDELYRINQQWLADYNDLKKQISVSSCQEDPIPSLPCQRCITMEREVEEKMTLLKDLELQLEKTTAKSKDARSELEEKNVIIQDLMNECSALRLQFQEIGGLSAAMRQRDDREDLIKEVQRLREKNTEVEKDRAKIQTQLNQFRLSVRQLLFNSSSQMNHTSNHAPNHTQYQLSSSRLASHSQAPPTSSYHKSTGGDTYDIRVPPGMAADGYVYPKQFAPKPTPRHYITYNPSSNGYKTPPTPPGLLSRGKYQHDWDSSPTRRYETHPYKPDTIVEQVVGGENPSMAMQPRLGLPPQRTMTSSQFLDPSIYQQDKLLSPINNTPRPMSAPGSLLVSPFSSDVHMLSTLSHLNHQSDSQSATSTPNSTNNSMTDLSLLHMPSSHTREYSTARPRPASLKLQQDSYHTSNSATSSPQYSESSVFSDKTIQCHHCNMEFPRHPDSCDAWLDHITNCALSGQ